MTENTKLRRTPDKSDAAVGDPGAKSDTKQRAYRLREALRISGGNAEIARRTGIARTTIDGYLAGGEMKLGNAVKLAAATGVRLEWLATGQGPMKEPAVPPESTPAPPRPLFSLINADRLGDAYAAALQALASRGHTRPEPRRVMQVTVLLYDELTEAEEANGKEAEASESATTGMDRKDG